MERPDPKEIIETVMEQIDHVYKKKEKAVIEKILYEISEGKSPKEAMGLTDKQMESLYAYAYNLFTHGKYKEARAMMDQLMHFDPDDPRYPLGCGAALQQMKEYQLAAGYYFLSWSFDQENPIPLFYMYECFKNLNEPVSALLMLENIVVRAANKPEHTVLVERATRIRDALKLELNERQQPKEQQTA